MRASLIEIEKIESFLSGRIETGEHMLTSAKIIIDTDFRKNVNLQKVIYDTIITYGRQVLRKRIKKVEKSLFEDPSNLSFQKEIKAIFKP